MLPLEIKRQSIGGYLPWINSLASSETFFQASPSKENSPFFIFFIISNALVHVKLLSWDWNGTCPDNIVYCHENKIILTNNIYLLKTLHRQLLSYIQHHQHYIIEHWLTHFQSYRKCYTHKTFNGALIRKSICKLQETTVKTWWYLDQAYFSRKHFSIFQNTGWFLLWTETLRRLWMLVKSPNKNISF